jgi:hypothetical protein
MALLNPGITDRLLKEWQHKETAMLNMTTAINLLGRKHIQQLKEIYE